MIKNKKMLILFSALAILLIFIIAFIIIIDIGAHNRMNFLKYNPNNQPETTWISDDKTIKIVVGGDYNARIYFENIDTQDEFDFSCGVGSFSASISVIMKGDFAPYESNIGEIYEEWEFVEVEQDFFAVEIKKSRFFKIGDRIKFYKVFDGSKNNEPQGETQSVSSLQRRQENRPFVSKGLWSSVVGWFSG